MSYTKDQPWACIRLGECPDGPHLNRPVTGSGDLLRHSNHFVQIAGFNQVVAAELLLGLGEWPITSQPLPVVHAHGGGSSGRLERVATLDTFTEFLAERPVLSYLVALGGLAYRCPALLLLVNQ